MYLARYIGGRHYILIDIVQTLKIFDKILYCIDEYNMYMILKELGEEHADHTVLKELMVETFHP